MAGKVLKMNNMNKFNKSAIMNKSADNPATTHTRNRCAAYKEMDNKSMPQASLLANAARELFYCSDCAVLWNILVGVK